MVKTMALFLLCSQCIAVSPTITSFNTGQVSPLLEARSDFQKYSSSARTIENMMVTTQGPVFRRPGTKYIATQKDSTAIGRLISYEHSVDDSYVLLLEDQAMRFFRDGGQILDNVGTEDLSGVDEGALVAHWLLNEQELVLVVNDDDPGTHDGNASVDASLLHESGKVGTGSFDLDIQYDVEIPDSSFFSFTDNSNDTPFSIVCWGFVTQQNDGQVLLSKWQDDGNSSEWRFSLLPNGKLQLVLSDGGVDLSGDVVSQWKLNDDAANTNVIQSGKTYEIDGFNDTTDTVTITGDGNLTTSFPDSSEFTIADSAANDGQYTVVSTTFAGDPAFVITIAGASLADADTSGTPTIAPHAGVSDDSNTEDINATGKINGALNFGGDQAMVIDDSTELSFGDGTNDSSFSISAWVYVTNTTKRQHILTKYDSTAGAEAREYRLSITTSEKLDFTIYDETGNDWEQVRTRMLLTTGWHHVVATYNGVGGTAANAGMTLYVDNEAVNLSLAGSGTYGAMDNTATTVKIGAIEGSGGTLTDYWNDKIDNVILFDIELNSAEVQSLYNDGSGTESLTAANARVSAKTNVAIDPGWHFFCCTYSAPADESTAASEIILYVDGEATAFGATNNANYTAMQDGAEEIRIGSQESSNGSTNEKFWGDKIDEMSVFSDVLTPSEIASLYSTTVYEIETPYLTADLFDLDFVKSEDRMYIVHPDHEPRQLSRLGHTLWTLDALNIGTGPFQAENLDTDLTITPAGASFTVDSSITLTAASGLFRAGHVNSIWQIDQVRATSQITGSFAANENGHSISTPFFSGAYGFTTSGNGNGTITLMRSTNGGASWRPALTALTNTDFDNPAEIEEDGAIYRVVISNHGNDTPTYTITITDNTNRGVVRITGVESGTDATATVVTALVESVDENGDGDGTSAATSNWREGYWSDFRGWPETVAIHQQRLTFGGSVTFPQTVWFGKTDPDDYTNFTEGTLDTSAFTVALAGNNLIQWMLSQDYLFIGNSGSCGKYGDQGKAVTPTSPNYREQTRQGSASLPAVIGGDEILYVERGSRKIREFVFDFGADKYLSPDLSVLSPEITESGIKDIAYQFRPYPILWCVLNNGDIATLTYQKDQSVIAWTKQITDGDFESITIIPDTTEDEVWVTVNRQIESTDARYVEQFQPQDWGSDPNDAWFVDSGISSIDASGYDGTTSVNFSGADHLDGETVSIYADLLIESPEVVVAGAITIDNAAARVLVGMPFTSKIETMPIVIDPQDKVANKKINRVWFDLYKSGAMEYGNGADSDLTAVLFFDNSLIIDPAETATDLHTSRIKPLDFRWVYGSTKKQTVYVETDQPMPLTIRSITLAFDLYGN